MSKPILNPLNALERLLLPFLRLTLRGSARERLNRRADLSRRRAERRKEHLGMVKGLKKECNLYEKLITDCFIRIGEAWMIGAAGIETGGRAPRKTKVQKVKFSRIFYNEEQVFFEIQVNKRWLYSTRNMLPHRVLVANLVSEAAIFELSHATRRLIKVSYDDPRYGCWIIVNRLMGFDGIPLFLSYKEVLELFPTNQIEDVPVIMGQGENRKLHHHDLAHNPHMLVGGSTRSGKSNFLNNFLCNLIRFSRADELKIVLIDLKRMEFGYYKNVPHLMRPIVFDEDEAVNVLDSLVKEIHRRTEMMADHAKELSEWNRKFPDKRLPRLIVIIDEFAELMLSEHRETARAVETLITRICNLGRAPGVHAVVATQRPASDVVHNKVKINMSLVVAGRVQNSDQSRVILGNSDAARLPDQPGRMIYLRGSNLVQVQTPFVADDDIQASVAIAKGRHQGVIDLDGYEPVIVPDGLIVYIVDCLQGKLTADSLKRLRPLGVPMRALKEFIQEVIRKGGWTVDKRIFKVEKREGNYWQLVETRRAKVATADDPWPNHYTIEMPALAYKPLLMLSAPIIEPVIERIIDLPRKPEPKPFPDETPSPDEPAPKPMPAPPKHPLTMSNDEIVDLFLERCCKKHGRYKVQVGELHRAYLGFCEALDEQILPVTIQKFSKMISARGFKKNPNHAKREFIGLKVVSDGLGEREKSVDVA